MTALHWAALMNWPAIGPLLEAGANPLAQNSQGLTPKSQAMKAGASVENVELIAAAEQKFGEWTETCNERCTPPLRLK